ncbi:diacylglycerol kinase family protein [Limosilactobacillus sp.]|uniref:diacylglycerol/lipid kinase family protein n=1 Tax=Limosilactobacillus sp. TaxID=2773925 RepID=UPI0035A1076B
MHYSIIINPIAGNGYAKSAWPAVHQALDQAQIDYDYRFTKRAGQATYFATKLAEKSQPTNTVVIAMGGDGTLHEVLNGLLKTAKKHQTSRLPLAYIPAGTGNDFARAYGIILDPVKALQQILATDHPQVINIGHYRDAIKNQDHYFLNNVGIGFDAAIVSRTNFSKAKKKLNRHHRIGHFAYASQALGVLYDQAPFTLMAQGDHEREFFSKAYIAIVTNHPYIGGGFRIAPTATIKEPALDLVVAERKNWLVTFWQLIQFARGKLADSRFAKHYHGHQFHCTTTSLEFGQVDGEEMGNQFMDLTMSVATYPFWQTSTNK